MSPFDARRKRLRERLASGEGDFVTTDLPTVRYLTGFTGSNATFVLGADRERGIEHGHGHGHLITDGRYRDQAARQCPEVDVVIDRDVIGALGRICATRVLRLHENTPIALAGRLELAGFEVVAIPDPAAELRAAKDDAEIDLLAEAGRITARALAVTASEIRVGDREVDIARKLEAAFGQLGAEDRAFPSIVAGGENSALPHHRAGERRLTAGDLLVIDCGAMVDGYHADMTRTFIVGAEPEDWQASIHRAVARAQREAIEALAPGALAHSIDSAARDAISQAGYGEAFTHGTGHGVGLQIHEAPMLSALSDARIPLDAVVTVEPGIYLSGMGGVRIEDTVAVSEPVQVLTPMDRALTRVG